MNECENVVEIMDEEDQDNNWLDQVIDTDVNPVALLIVATVGIGTGALLTFVGKRVVQAVKATKKRINEAKAANQKTEGAA